MSAAYRRLLEQPVAIHMIFFFINYLITWFCGCSRLTLYISLFFKGSDHTNFIARSNLIEVTHIIS